MIDQILTLTREEVAKIYGVEENTISQWASLGKIPRPLPGKNYLWSKKAIELHMIISSMPDKNQAKIHEFLKYVS
ncbi:MAG: helix-turn-helix domain-containing protein [Wohlfahrtiimonas sp.]